MARSQEIALALAMLLGCRDKPKPAEKPAPVPQSRAPEYRAFEAGGEIVAVSDDGGHVLARADAKLIVWSSGTQRGSLDALGPDPGRYAISNGGLVADSSDREIRIARANGDVIWRADLSETLWGDLAFTPDGSGLALLANGQVTIIDQTGKARTTIRSSELSLPRRVFYSADGKRLAIACGTNREHSANHTLFVADLATGTIVERLIAPHVDGILDALVLPDAIFTIDFAGTVRRFAGGQIRAELPLAAPAVLGGDTSQLAIASSKRVVVSRANELAQAPFDANEIPRFVSKPTAAGVFVIAGERGHAVPLPTTPVDVEWRQYHVAESRAWGAVWSIARDGTNAVADAVPLLAAATGDPVFRGALIIAHQVGKTSLAVTSEQAPDVLATAIVYLESGFLDLALLAYGGWLGEHLRAPRSDTEALRGRETGLRLVAMFGSSDDAEGQQLVCSWLVRAWPRDADVVEACASGADR